ncbi:angiopoietin-related protein 7-like isoform X2 [Pomacea canaliculata]|uniref:angiopoietin-related protein 7-like isoform X2 n=1 Tax=Pomacea canaliculata TaxID=400727 RepID=UPI000D725F15|nr:angiopoietin-related protein 7-like isoform X2 [Pomacea canaliculata]
MQWSWAYRSLTVVLFTAASNAILWSPSPEVENITACVGDDVSFPWSFTTSPSETVIDITWFLENGGNRTPFASLISDEFFSLSRQHVQFVPNAGFLLQNATVNDTGLYSLHIDTVNGTGHVTTSNRSAFLEVWAPPVLFGGQLVARHRAAPVRDDVTGTWHVTLECGQFTDRGQPPVVVEWRTPSGAVHKDAVYQGGYYLLPLQSVETGNYICTLSHENQSRRCLGNDHEVEGVASVYIADVTAEVAMLKANQSELINENQELRSQVQNLTDRLNHIEQLLDDHLTYTQDVAHHPSSCVDVKVYDSQSGVHTIFVGRLNMSVYCDQVTDGGGWTVFQRRQDGSLNFSRNWTEYVHGFGDLNGEFWIGLENLRALTSSKQNELRVDLEAVNGTRAYALYRGFRSGDTTNNYFLHFDSFVNGTAGDSLTPNREEMFSTHDHVNVANLTTTIHGGWWYTPSGESNLNGVYTLNSTTTNDTIFWNTFQGNETSLKRTEMKIRPFERNL